MEGLEVQIQARATAVARRSRFKVVGYPGGQRYESQQKSSRWVQEVLFALNLIIVQALVAELVKRPRKEVVVNSVEGVLYLSMLIYYYQMSSLSFQQGVSLELQSQYYQAMVEQLHFICFQYSCYLQHFLERVFRHITTKSAKSVDFLPFQHKVHLQTSILLLEILIHRLSVAGFLSF